MSPFRGTTQRQSTTTTATTTKRDNKTWWNALIRHKVQLIPMNQNECRRYYMALRIIKMMQKNCWCWNVRHVYIISCFFLSWHLEKWFPCRFVEHVVGRARAVECIIVYTEKINYINRKKNNHQAQWNGRYHRNTVPSIRFQQKHESHAMDKKNTTT